MVCPSLESETVSPKLSVMVLLSEVISLPRDVKVVEANSRDGANESEGM